MKINRELYGNWVSEKNMSIWQCPTCDKSLLQASSNNFIKEYNSETNINQNNEDFRFPHDITYTFTALLACSNLNCKEVVICSGTGCVEDEYYNYENRSYVEYFKPIFFYPPLNIFHIPKRTPENVAIFIKSSFGLAFINESAAANQIRMALENLLTHLRVNKTYTVNRKRKLYALHKRIELLPPKYIRIKDYCLAVKWLGNSGSHSDKKLSLDNIFDGYDMLSFILNELYDSQEKHAKKLAKTINAKKGV